MKINFILPSPYKSGGVIVILEYSRILQKKGHEVSIYYPLIPYMTQVLHKNRIRRVLSWGLLLVRNLKKIHKKFELFNDTIQVRPVAIIHDLFVDDADICFATAWSTAYSVSNLSSKKGKKYYLVQGYEIWGQYKQLVEESYRLPLEIITVSPWLTGIIEQTYKRKIAGEILNGVRLDRFFPSQVEKGKPTTILMQFHELECKGSAEGIQACSMIKREFPDVKIAFFSVFRKPVVDFELEYYLDPSYDQLLRLYQSAQIFLFPSHNEGWGMTPIEAMACKCAVVGTNIGSIHHFYNGKNVQLVEAKNVSSVYEGIKDLLLNENKRSLIAEEGYASIQNSSWENSVERLESVLNATNKNLNEP